MEWGKLLAGALAVLAGATGGGFATNGYNASEHRLELAAEQSVREATQRLFDAQNEAHARAMAAARATHADALTAAMEGYNASLRLIVKAHR